jgi:hypothetical protein
VSFSQAVATIVAVVNPADVQLINAEKTVWNNRIDAVDTIMDYKGPADRSVESRSPPSKATTE